MTLRPRLALLCLTSLLTALVVACSSNDTAAPVAANDSGAKTDTGSGNTTPADAAGTMQDSAVDLVDANTATPDGAVATDAGTRTDASASDAATAPVDAGSVCTTQTWANYGETFFNNTCNGCHGFSSVGAVRAQIGIITSEISSGDMPKNNTLSAADKTAALKYLNCGAP